MLKFDVRITRKLENQDNLKNIETFFVWNMTKVSAGS